MPRELVLHIVDPFALDRMRDDDIGAAWFEWDLRERALDGGMVMTIEFMHGPVEGFPLGGEGLEVEHLLHGAKALDFVVINDRNEVIELMVTGEEDRFPIRSFVEFAITEHDEGAPRNAVRPGGQGSVVLALEPFGLGLGRRVVRRLGRFLDGLVAALLQRIHLLLVQRRLVRRPAAGQLAADVRRLDAEYGAFSSAFLGETGVTSGLSAIFRRYLSQREVTEAVLSLASIGLLAVFFFGSFWVGVFVFFAAMALAT